MTRTSSQRVTRLTPAQEAALVEYRDKWIVIGRCTDPADRPRAEEGIRLAYQDAGAAPPERIVWCASPLEVTLANLNTVNGGGSEVPMEKLSWPDVRHSLDQTVGQVVWQDVWQALWQPFEQVVRVVDQAIEQVVDQAVRAAGQVGGQAARVAGQVAGQAVRQIYFNYFHGQHDANWLALYDYFHQVCGLREQTASLRGHWLIARSAGWWVPYPHVCWISERPRMLSFDPDGRLHHDSDPACGYPDGWGVYALHGVLMEPWMVKTPAEQLKPTAVLAVPNAEQRRELIRKVGVERLLAHLPHRVLDQAGEGMYELLSICFSEELPDARVLKMRNPSLGVWHVERVEDGLSTVQAALNWRNQDEEPTEVLT